MVTRIPHHRSAALDAEAAAISSHMEPDEAFFARVPTLEAYSGDFASRPEGMEVLRHLQDLPRGSRVLDVGVGQGESSLLLGSRGLALTAVEPSAESCRRLDEAARRYGVPLQVLCCTGEGLGPVDDRFDAVIFNSSLHHCDDPVAALAQAHRLLVPGGRLLLVNEPFLHFFRSKAWYYRRLQTHPLEMGHYGGNEHTYRHGEYRAMLRQAGFLSIRSELNVRNTDLDLVMRQLRAHTIEGRPVFAGRRLLVRKAYFGAISALARRRVGRPVLGALERLSLLNVTFVATKGSGA